jgi:hypothetical protein
MSREHDRRVMSMALIFEPLNNALPAWTLLQPVRNCLRASVSGDFHTGAFHDVKVPMTP